VTLWILLPLTTRHLQRHLLHLRLYLAVLRTKGHWQHLNQSLFLRVALILTNHRWIQSFVFVNQWSTLCFNLNFFLHDHALVLINRNLYLFFHLWFINILESHLGFLFINNFFRLFYNNLFLYNLRSLLNLVLIKAWSWVLHNRLLNVLYLLYSCHLWSLSFNWWQRMFFKLLFVFMFFKLICFCLLLLLKLFNLFLSMRVYFGLLFKFFLNDL